MCTPSTYHLNAIWWLKLFYVIITKPKSITKALAQMVG